MLSKMESIAIAMWNRLNENNLKIQMEFEECIADNRNEYSWKDISLSWEEAEEIAAEEYVRHLATQSSNSKKQRTNQETIKTKSISYKEMKEKIKRSIGYTDTAIQRATHRALKKALEEKIKPPIPMGGCVDSFAIQEIHSFDKLKGPTVDSCKYICIRQVTD